MGDIRIIFDNATGTGDFAMDGAGLATGFELETAVLISLFTDCQADPGDPGWMDADPRGWWADTFLALEDPTLTPIPGDRTGSKLWQIFNMPRNQQTLNWMRNEIAMRLDWMITDNLASAIDVAPRFTSNGGVGAALAITANGVPTRFDYAWRQEG